MFKIILGVVITILATVFIYLTCKTYYIQSKIMLTQDQMIADLDRNLARLKEASKPEPDFISFAKTGKVKRYIKEIDDSCSVCEYDYAKQILSCQFADCDSMDFSNPKSCLVGSDGVDQMLSHHLCGESK